MFPVGQSKRQRVHLGDSPLWYEEADVYRNLGDSPLRYKETDVCPVLNRHASACGLAPFYFSLFVVFFAGFEVFFAERSGADAGGFACAGAAAFCRLLSGVASTLLERGGAVAGRTLLAGRG